jgi:hypothetical protein
MSINGATTLTVSGLTMDNSAGDTDSLGHNTDAFDVGSSTGVTISGANMQVLAPLLKNLKLTISSKNQDDCLAINSGTSITFTGGTCSGGHGLSIGSVGGRDDNTVKTVLIESSTVKASQNGVRIKTVYDATGTVSGVTYKDITLSGITKYGVVIEQDYENGSPTGTPTTGCPSLILRSTVSLERCPRLGLTFIFSVGKALARTGKQISLLFVLLKLELSRLHLKQSDSISMLLHYLKTETNVMVGHGLM